MKDILSIEKLTTFLQQTIELVGDSNFSIEDFMKDMRIGKDKEPTVLRELSQEESLLLYTDYSLYRAMREKLLTSRAPDMPISKMQGRFFYHTVDALIGVGVRFLTVSALLEFALDERLKARDKTIRIEMAEDAICFVLVKQETPAIVEQVESILKSIFQQKAQPYATTSQEAAVNAFDLASWVPDNGEAQ